MIKFLLITSINLLGSSFFIAQTNDKNTFSQIEITFLGNVDIIKSNVNKIEITINENYKQYLTQIIEKETLLLSLNKDLIEKNNIKNINPSVKIFMPKLDYLKLNMVGNVQIQGFKNLNIEGNIIGKIKTIDLTDTFNVKINTIGDLEFEGDSMINANGSIISLNSLKINSDIKNYNLRISEVFNIHINPKFKSRLEPKLLNNL